MEIRPLLRQALLALCVLSVACLCGCKSKPAPGGLIPITLQTDWYPQPEMGGFYQAKMQGLYKAAGLDVTIAPGGPMVVAQQQVATGAAQFAMGSSDQVLVYTSHGLPLVAVGATMQKDPQCVMVHAESSVQDFADLEGKTLAVKPGSIWFEYLLKKYRLVHLREIPATYSIANFLQDPNYAQQCFVTSEPYFARKAGANVRTLLINSTGYKPYRVFYTSKAFLDAHPDVVAKFVKASIEGWKNYLADPAQVNAELSKLNPAMSPAQMQYSVDTLKAGHFIDGEGTPESHLGHFTKARWDDTYQQLLDLKVMEKPINPDSAYSSQFAP